MRSIGEGNRCAKIVATLGPATQPPNVLDALLRAPVDVVRLNFSHGTHEIHGRTIAMVREISQRLGRSTAVLQDLQGPKIRTGTLAGGHPVTLDPGNHFTITTQSVAGTEHIVSTTYRQLPRDVHVGDRLLLSDGMIELRVIEIENGRIVTEVVRGGLLGEHTGINVPRVSIKVPSLTEKDKADLAFGISQRVDYVALSFVRSQRDVLMAKEFLSQHGADIPIVAKLERAEAIDHLDEILDVSDGVMVARGDMGVELPPERVPPLQKQIIREANSRGIPVITATQMLESMVKYPYPTRAEVSDVANAIWDGTDAVMLSGETAVGAYPIEAIQMMHRIIVEAEATASRLNLWHHPTEPSPIGYDHAISHAARGLAQEPGVRAIAAFTRSGRTAQVLSQARPGKPILAFTPDEVVYRRLNLWWGVRPFIAPFKEHIDAMIEHVEKDLIRTGIAREGDGIIIVGSSPLVAKGRTNFVKAHIVGSKGEA